MARVRHQFEIVKAVFGLAALLVIGWTFSPQFRPIVVVVVIAVIVLWGVYLLAHMGYRSPAGSFTDSTVAASSLPFSSADLVQQLRSLDWYQFEKLVGAVYRKSGYSVTRRGGANPDGGIDLILELGGNQIAVQCKQWKSWNVGVKAVREFLGALTDVGIQRGIFVTLCGYTGEAKQLAEKHGIEIVNETGLAKLLESVDAQFDPEIIAVLHDTRKVCPKCESDMVLRTATKGRGTGQKFWGCAAYPRCRFTMPV